MKPSTVGGLERVIDVKAEHKWAAPELQDVPICAAESTPLDTIGNPKPIDPTQPVPVRDLRFNEIGVLLAVKAFAVVCSKVAV